MFRLLSPAALVAVVTLAACGPSLESASLLQITDPPQQVTAGEPIAITVTVKNEDGETIKAYNEEITASVEGPDGAKLTGTTTVKAKEGVAQFDDLRLTRAVAEQRLIFRPQQVGGSRIALKKSRAITVTAAAADHLIVTPQPAKGAPGGVLYPFAIVQVVDAFDNVVTSALQITVSLGANATGATLGGTLTRTTADGGVEFNDLAVDKAGTGYTLVFSAPGVTPFTTAQFSVAAPRLAYTDPPATAAGKIRVVKNAALSTDTVVVLDVKVASAIDGAYAAGINLPVDLRTVRAPVSGGVILAGSGLNPGTSPAAIVGALDTQGAGAGILTAGISQKAAGAGAVTSDVSLAADTVLFSIRIEVLPTALFKTVFDGAALGTGFGAAVRNRAGEDVVRGFTWAIGRLEVQ